MKNLTILFLLLTFISGCDETSNFFDEFLDGNSKYVAIGDSLTAGIQSDGLEGDFQENSFPNLIATQLGINDFEQPIVESPGIGFGEPGESPIRFENGNLFREDFDFDPFDDLLENFFLDRPYDNLGLPGAELVDVDSTSELIFQIILRGMGTQLEQAVRLDPEIVTLWIGNNDVLGVANGGELSGITPPDEFEEDYRDILEELTSETDAMIVVANIPNVTDIPLVNFFDDIFRPIPEIGIMTPVPVLYDPQSFEPIDFGTNEYAPLLTEEADIAHVLLDIIIENSYIDDGEGIPDISSLEDFGFSSEQVQNIIFQIEFLGLKPTGKKINKDSTLTVMENSVISDAVDEINNIISNLANEFNIPLVDANAALFELNSVGIDGYTGEFVLKDPENTFFSLDGVHANNAGYAVIANRFIEALNDGYSLGIPLVDTEQFRGQYTQ